MTARLHVCGPLIGAMRTAGAESDEPPSGRVTARLAIG